MFARNVLVLGALIGVGLSGCDDQTIDKAAQETKEAVDAAARTGKKANDAADKMLDDAKSGTKELIEKLPDGK